MSKAELEFMQSCNVVLGLQCTAYLGFVLQIHFLVPGAKLVS